MKICIVGMSFDCEAFAVHQKTSENEESHRRGKGTGIENEQINVNIMRPGLGLGRQ